MQVVPSATHAGTSSLPWGNELSMNRWEGSPRPMIGVRDPSHNSFLKRYTTCCAGLACKGRKGATERSFFAPPPHGACNRESFARRQGLPGTNYLPGSGGSEQIGVVERRAAESTLALIFEVLAGAVVRTDSARAIVTKD